ncbi:MAG: nickel pincer cofactor biosynthesis protein LarC [Candidatus Hydrogenedentes bacterium]|nr:nickel pincer cofactor biosynthesis protein LarC [Candidatus Hydrogenedentota bacterium]
MKTLYLDCLSGISGDMTVAALLDLGADFGALNAGLASLGVPDFEIFTEKTVKRGMAATRFEVRVAEHDHHPHRHLRHVLEIIDRGALPESVKAGAAKTFRLIAEAEAAVHGTTVEKVHFHEVGAIDSIVDVVGAELCLHLLGVDRVVVSPINTGTGTVRCAHGVMPVPAPATALLLCGVPVYGDGDGELTTPTGAALAAAWASSFGPLPRMTVEAVGCGAGTRDLPDRANVLRALLGESEDAPAGDADTVAVLETLVDDLSGELTAPAVEAALAAGAVDAFLTPVTGKKGRPAFLLTALCPPELRDAVARSLFLNTTTLGVRIREERRTVLRRDWETVSTPYGEVRVKTAALDGERITAHPEFEDCRALAEAAGVPVRRVADAALAAFQRGEE